MRILAIDTSTQLGSIALATDEELLAECAVKVSRGHAAFLLPTLRHLLGTIGWDISDIEWVACATGPGSFAALRVGISTVKGIAFATGAGMIGVNTLESMALPFSHAKLNICPVIDAKKEQVYAALFSGDGHGRLQRISEDLLIQPEKLTEILSEKTLILGDGAIRYRSRLAESLGGRALFLPESICYHRAGAVAGIGLEGIRYGKRDDRLMPHYIRPPDAVAKGLNLKGV